MDDSRQAPSGSTAVAPDGARGRMPDFFIVGHPKCGTTAVYAALKDHPQVLMPAIKEPNFFSLKRDLEGPLPEGIAPSHANRLDRYMALFEDAEDGQLAGESSVFNLWSPTAARSIAERQPSARIIAMLREPASFLRSLYLQFAQSGVETAKTFEVALELEDSRRATDRFPSLLYGDYVPYVEQIERYRAAFPSDQVLVLLLDDLRHDSDDVLRQIMRFLEIDESAPIAAPMVNPTVRVRSTGLNRMTHHLRRRRNPLLRGVRTGLEAAAPRGTRRRSAISTALNGVLYGPPEKPEEELMLALRERFRPEVVALSEYLGRDMVAEWGYDAPADPST